MTFFSEFLSNTRNTILARTPFVCITTAYIGGIVLFRFAPVEVANWLLLSILCFGAIVCVLFSLILKNIHLELLLLWFILFGYVNSAIHQHQYVIISNKDQLIVKVISSREDKPKSYKVMVVSLEENSCKSILYVQKDSLSQQLEYGDILQVKNTLKYIENQKNNSFDYKGFLANQYVYSQGYVRKCEWKKLGHETSLYSLCMQLRNSALKELGKMGVEEHNLQLLAALAFGDKSLLDEETKNEFSTAGAMHVLAVSGLHVGIINGILFFIFSFLANPKLLWLKIVCCVGGIWTYACVTGMSPSVERASIMCSMVSIALLLRRRTSTYNSLAVAAFFSLFVTPNDIFSVSFQLSYLAVVSILYFGTYIQNVLHPDTAIGSYLWGILAVSISVQIGTLPLTLYYFGTMPTYSLLTNIFVIPLAFVILICVVIVLLFCWLPILATHFVSLLNFVTTYLQDTISDISTFPHAKMSYQLTLQQTLLVYCCLGLCIVIFEFFRQLQIKKEILRL